MLLFCTGLCMGTVMGVVQVTVQSAAGAASLGSAAASVQLSRALGAAFGTALVGTVLFAVLTWKDPERRSCSAPWCAKASRLLRACRSRGRLRCMP